MRIFILGIILTTIGNGLNAQTRLFPADQVLKEAVSAARVEKKKVLIFFSASWCGWCHAMDSAIHDPSCKGLFESHYIIRNLDVKEETNKKYLENPGAEEMLKHYHGDDQGIPFWLIFDENGKLIADSQLRNPGEDLNHAGENVGCPSTQKEIKFFTMILKQTSSLNDQELKIIATRFAETHD